MAFAGGKVAYCKVATVAKTFDEWSLNLARDKADVSDFDRKAARWLPGLPVATVSMSGPYSVNALGMVVGTEYAVELGITALVFVTVTVQIETIRPRQSVRGAARVEVTGVVNSNFLTESTITGL